MAQLLRKLFRGTVLGLMLLLAGAANLVCISYDADDDEDTPPISVELNIVTPCKRSIQLPKLQIHARTFRLQDEKPSTGLLASAQFQPAPLLNEGPPQLLLPLRR
jgi:hypothetical protein